jgi:hypothetical protein
LLLHPDACPGIRAHLRGPALTQRRRRVKDSFGRYGFGEKARASGPVVRSPFAPVCTRFHAYDVPVSEVSRAYCETIMGWEPMKVWVAAARLEPEEFDELDMEF